MMINHFFKITFNITKRLNINKAEKKLEQIILGYKVIDRGEISMGSGVTEVHFRSGLKIKGIINNFFWFSEDKKLIACVGYKFPITVFEIMTGKKLAEVGHSFQEFIELNNEYLVFKDGIGTLRVKLNYDNAEYA